MIEPATEEKKQKVHICWMEPTKNDSAEFSLDRIKYVNKNKEGEVTVDGPNIHILVEDTYVGPAFVEMANMEVCVCVLLSLYFYFGFNTKFNTKINIQYQKMSLHR